MIGGITDMVPMRLQLVVIPRGGRLDDERKAPHQVFRRMALEIVFGGAVLYVTPSARGIEKRRMRLGNADHVGAHIKRYGFDVSRHNRRIVDGDPARIDLAVCGAVDDVDQKMPAIGKMVWCRDAGQRIFGDRVSIQVAERFSKLAALIFWM